MKIKFYQHRDFKYTYLFEVKNNNVILKIFNIAREQLFKHKIPISSFTQACQKDVLNMPLLTKDLPAKYCILNKSSKAKASLQLLGKRINDSVNEQFAEVFAGKIFTDPINGCALKDPVTDTEGHTFEKKSIETWLQKSNLCPLGRHTMKLPLVENRLVKRIMDDVRQGRIPSIPRYKDPVIDERGCTHEKVSLGKKTKNTIPNRIIKDYLDSNDVNTIPSFSYFQKEDKNRAKHWLEKASQCAKREEYDFALECYKHAFKYTKDWNCYKNIPVFFEKLKEYDKMFLSYLLLAKYQLSGGDLNEAIHTLETCQKKRSRSLEIDLWLIDLYCATDKLKQATDLASQFVANNQLKEAFLAYKHLLQKDPSQISLYCEIAKLAPSPSEKTHILCKGANEAFLKKRYAKAGHLMQLAKSSCKDFFLDELISMEINRQLLGKRQSEQSIITIARSLKKKRLLKNMLLAYKMIPKSKYEPADQKNIYYACKTLGKNQKAIQWLTEMAKNRDKLDLSQEQIGKNIYLLKNLTLFSKELNFSNNDICDETLKILTAKMMSPFIQRLYLSHNNIKYQTDIPLPPNLQLLDLSSNQIGYAGLKKLARHLPASLKSLNLSFNKIKYAGLKELAKHFPVMLQSLDLSGNNIGDAGIKKLAKHFPASLQSLDLRYNNIGDAGIKKLAKHLPAGLKSLDLGSNKIGDAGIKKLAKHLPASLQSLSLRWIKIGDAGIKELAKHLPVTLQSLDLSGNNIGDAGLKELAKHLPNTHIVI